MKNLLAILAFGLIFTGCNYSNWNLTAPKTQKQTPNSQNSQNQNGNFSVNEPANVEQTEMIEENIDFGNQIEIPTDESQTTAKEQEKAGTYQIATIVSLWGTPNSVKTNEDGTKSYIWKSCKETGKNIENCEDGECVSKPQVQCCDRILNTDEQNYVTNLKEAIQNCK